MAGVFKIDFMMNDDFDVSHDLDVSLFFLESSMSRAIQLKSASSIGLLCTQTLYSHWLPFCAAWRNSGSTFGTPHARYE